MSGLLNFLTAGPPQLLASPPAALKPCLLLRPAQLHTSQAQGTRAVADIGGSIITGIDGNPLAVLVKQMGLHMADIRSGGCEEAV